MFLCMDAVQGARWQTHEFKGLTLASVSIPLTMINERLR